jgi:hypothetical protein
MAFEGWGHYFEGPFSSADDLKSIPGVYVVWCQIDAHWKIQDAGETDNVLECIRNHEREACWKKYCPGRLYYSASYLLDRKNRQNLENTILASPAAIPCTLRVAQGKEDAKS